jgi:hypothetical protein
MRPSNARLSLDLTASSFLVFNVVRLFACTAEYGDYVENRDWVSLFVNRRFYPHQKQEHMLKIMEYYRAHS